MSSILLDFHNKLGDNIVCNGLVRTYATTHSKVGIFCIPRYHVSVEFMYRDVPAVQLELVKDHRAKQFFHLRRRLGLGPAYDEVKIIYDDPETGIVAERQFYALAGVPHANKWGNFHVTRDLEREKEFYRKCIPAEPYQFLHDDSIYSSGIKVEKINPHLTTFRANPKLTDNIFDYCTIIEKAQEVHVVDSVFMFLVDCLPYSNPSQKLVVHRYARFNPPWKLPILRKNWTILS